MIIRHGEKPADKNAIDLAPRGRQRAQALATFFATSPDLKPDVLVATSAASSQRPIQTLTPLARRMGLELHHAYAGEQYRQLAKRLLIGREYAGQIVLICWRHTTLPFLASSLGAVAAPREWDKHVFDRIWRIDYVAGAATFRDLPQRLLPGDSPT